MAVHAAPSGGSSPDIQAGTGASATEHAAARAVGELATTSGPVARIDTAALAHNFSETRRLVGPAVDIVAMVKSNAYGHGAALCAPVLAAAGCRSFGVATVEEAAEISPLVQAASRAATRVLVLGGILPGEAAALVDAGAEVATQEIEVARAVGQAAAARGVAARLHVKVDTGMHRLGVDPAAAVDFVRAASALPGVRVAGLCSHFALAECVTGEVTAGQLETLLSVDAALRDAGFALERHFANSAAILARPEAHLDAVRPGIMLYGVAPDAALADRASLRPVMTLVARVIRVARIGAGEGVGYGHEFRTQRPTRLATVRCGYADGLPRVLGNRAEALVRGARVPLVGRICMDHAMFDVTDAGDVAVGDELVLWGSGLAVDEVARRAGTISYEMLARVARRVRREPAS